MRGQVSPSKAIKRHLDKLRETIDHSGPWEHSHPLLSYLAPSRESPRRLLPATSSDLSGSSPPHTPPLSPPVLWDFGYYTLVGNGAQISSPGIYYESWVGFTSFWPVFAILNSDPYLFPFDCLGSSPSASLALRQKNMRERGIALLQIGHIGATWWIKCCAQCPAFSLYREQQRSESGILIE